MAQFVSCPFKDKPIVAARSPEREQGDAEGSSILGSKRRPGSQPGACEENACKRYCFLEEGKPQIVGRYVLFRFGRDDQAKLCYSVPLRSLEKYVPRD